MHGKTDYEVGNNTIFDILSEPMFDFIGSIGTMIDYYAALHPEIGTPVDLVKYIACAVRDVSEIATVTTKEAKKFMKAAKMVIKDYICEKCGRDDFILRIRSSFYGLKPIRVDHYGIYCSYCGKWLKWANKNERFLFLEDNKK